MARSHRGTESSRRSRARRHTRSDAPGMIRHPRAARAALKVTTMRLSLIGAVSVPQCLRSRRRAAHAAGDHDVPPGPRRSSRLPRASGRPPSSRASTGSASASRVRRARRRWQPVRQQPRRRPRPHRADRELADGDLHEEGQAVRHDGPVLYGPVRHEHALQGLRRRLRGAQQRRRGRPLRPAREPLADRDAALPARSGRGRISRRHGRRRRRRSSARPAARTSPAPPRRSSCRRRPRLRHRAAAAAARSAGHGGSAPPRPQGPYSMCYAISTARDPLGAVLPLRVPAAALPRLPASRGLARRLLRADEHQRRRIPSMARSTPASSIARRCSRAQPATEQCLVIDGVNFLNNADIDGTALPPRGAPNIMIAAGGTQLKSDPRRRRASSPGGFTWTGGPGEDVADRTAADRASRRIATCATDS